MLECGNVLSLTVFREQGHAKDDIGLLLIEEESAQPRPETLNTNGEKHHNHKQDRR